MSFLELCKTATLREVITRCENKRPIDFRDILKAMKYCIINNDNLKFIYLFRRYIKPDTCLTMKFIENLQLKARVYKNSIIIKYLASVSDDTLSSSNYSRI
jgi:hypothetical protein